MTVTTRRTFLAHGVALLAAPLAAEAQQTGKVYRIGHLSLMSGDAMAPYVGALEQGLRDLGYVNGRNIIIEHRSADGRAERFPELAADLVRLKADVIVTGMDSGVVALKQATTTIPIVMIYGVDPVGQGFIHDLRRPGGNVTGGTFDPTPDMYGKRLELMRQILPRLRSIALLWNPNFAGGKRDATVTSDYARRLGLKFQGVEIRDPADLENAFGAIGNERTDAVVVAPDPVLFPARVRIGELAARYRLPLIGSTRDWADAGGLMAYGPNLLDRWRRAASYVDKILKGANAADIPVEQPTTFELVLNLKTAKALGLTIPPSLLLRADQVIE